MADMEISVGVTDERALRQAAALEARMKKAAKESEAAFDKANNGILGKMKQAQAQHAAEMQSVVGRYKGQFQQFGFQMTDVVTQMNAGTDAARALSMQLPQLLGGFGALGAVMGLVVSLAIPIGAALFDMGDASEEAANQAKAFDDSLQNARGAMDAFNNAINTQSMGAIDALIEKYGRADEAVRDLETRMRSALKGEAVAGFREAIDQNALGSLIGADSQVARVFERVMELRKQAEDARAKLEELNKLQASTTGPTLFPAVRMQQAADIEDARQAVIRLNEEAAKFGVTPEQIATFNEARDALQSALDAGNFTGAADALETMQAILRETGDTELVRVADQLDQVNAALREGEAQAGNLAAAAASISFAGAIAEAYDLASALSTAAAQLSRLEARQASLAARADIRKRYVGDPVGEARALAGQEFNEALPDRAGPHDVLTSEQRADFETRRQAYADEAAAIATVDEQVRKLGETERQAGRGGGGRRSGGARRSGGGASKREQPGLFEGAERDLERLERQIQVIGKSKEEVAELRARWELLDEAKKRGIPINETLTAQIDAQAANFGRLTGELERAEIAQDQFEQAIDGIAGAMSGALLEGESLREGLANVFKGIAADILEAGIQNALRQAFNVDGGGGGLWGAILGAIGLGGGGSKISAWRPDGRALGGPVSAGTPYLVGERGPEIIVPTSPGQVIPNHALGSEAAGQVHVTVSVSPTGEFDARVAEISGAVASAQVRAYDKTMPSRVLGINRDPRRR